MKNVNFKYSALWLLLLAIVTSCVFDEADPLVENTAPQDPVMVTFKLDVMSSAATKADDLHWYDAYAPKDPGNEFENKIIASDLKIMAYSAEADGDFIKELPVVSSMPVRNSEGKITHYTYSCIFNAPIPQDANSNNRPKFRFMVFANCINDDYRLSYNKGIPEVGKLTYDIPDNIVGVLVNPLTGALATDTDKKKKLFYFLKGTEPHVDSEYVLDDVFNIEKDNESNEIIDNNENIEINDNQVGNIEDQNITDNLSDDKENKQDD